MPLPLPSGSSPLRTARSTAGSPLLRLALRAGVSAGLALPLVAGALPAAAAQNGTARVQAALPQATVAAVEGRCAVRVTLRADVGPATVLVTARTVAATAAAERDAVVQDDGRWSATAGASRSFTLDLAPAAATPAAAPASSAPASDDAAQPLEVTVTVGSAAPETTPLSLASCRPTATPSATPAPSGTPTASPQSASPQAAGPGGTPSPSGTASPSAGPTGSPTSSPSARPVAVPTATPAATPTSTTTPTPRPDAVPAPVAAPAPVGAAPGVSVLVGSGSAVLDLGGAPSVLATTGLPLTGLTPLPLLAALPGVGVAQLPSLAAPAPVPAPQTAAGPLPQLAPPASVFPPAPVPTSEDDEQETVAFNVVRTPPQADVVADLLPTGSALALCVLALRGMVRRRRA